MRKDEGKEEKKRTGEGMESANAHGVEGGGEVEGDSDGLGF